MLDWANQAILIGSVRDKIVECRSLGIRDAVDLAVLYGDSASLLDFAAEPSAQRKERAEKLFTQLAQKTSYSVETVKLIARQLYDDFRVNFIWDCELYDEQPWVEGVLQAAVAESATQCEPGFSFSIRPRLGQPVRPGFPTAGTFGPVVESAIRARLKPIGYDWTGTYDDFKSESEWSVVLGRIFAQVSLRTSIDDAGMANGGTARPAANNGAHQPQSEPPAPPIQ